MTQTKSLTAAVMGEAGEVLSILGRGSVGLIFDVGSISGDVFGGIASGSVEVVRSITSGAGDIIKDTTSIFSDGIWSILSFINNILIWMAIVAIWGTLSRNTLLTLCRRRCYANGQLDTNPSAQVRSNLGIPVVVPQEEHHLMADFTTPRHNSQPHLVQGRGESD